MRADGFDDAEGVRRIAEVRDVAGQDRDVGRGELRRDAIDREERHVDVAEADEAHDGASSRRPDWLQCGSRALRSAAAERT